jgi:hypothetical protein
LIFDSALCGGGFGSSARAEEGWIRNTARRRRRARRTRDM